MEITKNEVEAVLAALLKVEEVFKELTDLELTLTGGGIGDVVLG